MEQLKTMELYRKKGMVAGAVGALMTLFIGIAVITLVIIFTGTLGGQTYNLAEANINNISDATIKQYVKDSVTSSFKAQKQTADYLPLVALAVIIGLVLVIVVGLGGLTNGGNRGSAL